MISIAARAPRTSFTGTPLLELPPSVIELNDYRPTTHTISRTSSISTSSNVILLPPRRGPFLSAYSYDYPCSSLRVTNFTSEDSEIDSDREDESVVNVPDVAEDEYERGSNNSTGSTHGRDRSVRFVDADLSSRTRSRSSPTPKPGDERRRFEEFMEARNKRGPIRTGLSKFKSTVKQWCIKRVDSIQALSRDEDVSGQKAEASATHVLPGSATAVTSSPRTHMFDESTPRLNGTASTASTQPGHDSNADPQPS